MKNYHFTASHTYFAAPYGTGAYSTDVYNGSTTTSTGDSGNGGTNGGVLTNTGFEVLVAITLACLIIFVALLIRLGRRKPAQAAVAVQAAANSRRHSTE